MTQPTPTEKGFDEATSVCPRCGTQLTSVREADQSVSVSACPKCYPAEAAAAPAAPAAVPTETGVAPETTTGSTPAAQ